MPSERLKTVLAIGDTLALFPVLKDWPTEELQALLADVDEYARVSDDAIDKAWLKTAMEPSLFFNRANAAFLDRVREQEKMDLLAMTAEICSVAIYYLEERGIRTENPDEGV